MNYLTRVDMVLSNLLEHMFKLGRGHQPSDLARMLKRAAVSNERKTLKMTYAPNVFLLAMAPADLARIQPIVPEVTADLTRSTKEYIEGQGLSTMGPIAVSLGEDEDLARGKVRVRVQFQAEGQA